VAGLDRHVLLRMTSRVRIGVIGVGTFGQRHLGAYARQAVEVVGIADCDRERARSVSERFGVDRWFGDGVELIEECRPDGVSVVTPAGQHLDPTLAALSHGCAVLLEKPIAPSSVEVRLLEAAARDSRAFVMPAHILRFAPPCVSLRERVAEGGVGRLLAIHSSRDRGRDHLQLYPDVHPALMTLIHDIDLALWISGAPALKVTAQERGTGAPALVWAHIGAGDGSLWSLRTSWLLPDGASIADRVEVYGSLGAELIELTADDYEAALDAELAHFCACVRKREASSVVTLTDAAHGIRVAEAVIASAAAGGSQIDISG
jgi:predicted dehydrogenase